jgi:hypothetical protein
MGEGKKVVTLPQRAGRLMVTADLHGNWEDFVRLRGLFHAANERGEDPVWVSVGDWVHGPSADRPPVLSRSGELLYDYPDRSADIVRALFSLMDRYPDRVVSICGNHELAHIGGPRTRKFHDDEAAFLEAQLRPEEVRELRARFACWPIAVRVPACGVVITHGAMAPGFAHPEQLERIRYGVPNPLADEVLASAMTWYGFSPGQDTTLLERMRDPGGPAYHLIVHGHDREEQGYARTGERALLLCTSFGALRTRKAYLWLDLRRRYEALDELQEGEEIRLLWGDEPPRRR